MALTAQEEALVRQLLDEQAAILSLAGSEATILSKLGATKVTLSDLTAVSTVSGADLLLMRQGTTDKSLSASIFGAYAAASVPDASETVKGKIEISSVAESQALTDLVRALTPGRLASALQGSNQNLTSNGYQRFPGGLILQWGISAVPIAANGGVNITFPIAFPNNAFTVVPGLPVDLDATAMSTSFRSLTTSGFRLTNGAESASTGYSFIAVGN